MKKLSVILFVALLLIAPIFANGSNETKASASNEKPVITMWAPLNAYITQVAYDRYMAK